MSMLTTVYLIERYGLRLTMEQLAQVLGLAVATRSEERRVGKECRL